MRLCSPFLLLLCVLAGAAGGARAQVELRIEEIAPFDADPGRVRGRALGVDPAEAQIAAYIFHTGLGWFSKPTCDAPTTALDADGEFDILLTTGGVDPRFSRVALFAVPASLEAPCVIEALGLPQEIEQAALAQRIVHRPDPNQRLLAFSGRDWLVKASTVPVGPGPNVFRDRPANVFVDEEGRLHLRITQLEDGRWANAEVVSVQKVGYGRYEFTVDHWNLPSPCVILGAFTWAEAERVTRELDALEIGKFCDPMREGDAQFVVSPFDQPGHLERFELPSGPVTTVMIWTPDEVQFQTFEGDDPGGELIHEWTFQGEPPTPDSEDLNFRFNLWLFEGRGLQPGESAEAVIRDFSYEPLETDVKPRVDGAGNAADGGPAAAPCGLASLFGDGFAEMETAQPTLPAPRSLGGAVVEINGIPAPLLYVGPRQINVQVPCETPLGLGRVVVRAANGSSDPAPLPIAQAALGLFQFPSGMCIAQHADWRLADPDLPIPRGSHAIVYATGAGPAEPPAPTGEAAGADPLSRVGEPAGAAIEDLAAALAFFGLAPGLLGVAQANIRIPEQAPTGLRTLSLTVGVGESGSTASCQLPIGE